MTSKYKIIGIVILFFLLGFFIYTNVITGEFFLDDTNNIVGNSYIKDFSHLREIFTQDSVAGAGFKLGWYRPILLITYAIDFRLWGRNTIGYHVVNILFHISSAILLFFFSLKLFKKIRVAVLSSLIFLIHPVQTEAVSYISGRADLLLVFFILISFLLFQYFLEQRSDKKNIFLILSSLSFIAALLSKETAIVFPFLLIFLLIISDDNIDKNKFKKMLKITAPLFLIAGIYQILRMTVLDFTNTFSLFGHNIFNRTLAFIKVLPIYWGDLIWPTNLYYHYEKKIDVGFPDLQTSLSILFIIFLLILIWRCRNYRNILLLAFGWFFIGMFPVSGILVPINFAIGERWLYFAAIGIFMACAVFLDQLLSTIGKYKKYQNLIWGLLVVYLSFFAILAIKRNFIWRDGLIFAKDTIAHAPPDAELYSFLGSELIKRDLNDDALNAFEKALLLDPKNIPAIYNAGVLYASTNLDQEQIKEFDKILALSAERVMALDALAQKYATMKSYKLSIKILDKLIYVEPNIWELYNEIGYYYFFNHQPREAMAAFERALALNPTNGQIRANIKAIEK